MGIWEKDWGDWERRVGEEDEDMVVGWYGVKVGGKVR